MGTVRNIVILFGFVLLLCLSFFLGLSLCLSSDTEFNIIEMSYTVNASGSTIIYIYNQTDYDILVFYGSSISIENLVGIIKAKGISYISLEDNLVRVCDLEQIKSEWYLTSYQDKSLLETVRIVSLKEHNPLTYERNTNNIPTVPSLNPSLMTECTLVTNKHFNTKSAINHTKINPHPLSRTNKKHSIDRYNLYLCAT